jgi:hypothetical protein
VDDLGGTSSSSYAPSGEVLDAIEAFRQEELTALATKDEAPRRWYEFWRSEKAQTVSRPEPEAVLPLEERKIEISGFASTSIRRSAVVRRESGAGRRVAWVAGALVGLVLLYFVGVGIKSALDGYLGKNNVKTNVVIANPAVAILDGNGPALDALKAAIAALGQNDTPDNRSVLDRAREQVRKEVHNLFDSIPWQRTMLDEASSLVSQALDADPSSAALKDLKEEVNHELVLYKMSIASIDAGQRQVVLRISYPGQQSENILYGEGGKVKGRLEVKRISQDGVTLEDSLRKSSGGLPRRFKLTMDGNISVM